MPDLHENVNDIKKESKRDGDHEEMTEDAWNEIVKYNSY